MGFPHQYVAAALLLWSGVAAAVGGQAQGIFSNGILRPPDYRTLKGPESAGQSYVDPVFGTVVTRMTDSGPWAKNGNGGEIANSEVAYFNADDSLFMISEYVRQEGRTPLSGVLYDGRTGRFVKSLGSGTMRPWWCRWAVADRYRKGGGYVRFEPSRHFYKYEGNELRLYCVDDLSFVVLRKFSEYAAIGPAGGEGDLSLDGRYWLLDGDGRELFLYDLIDDRKCAVSAFDVGELGSRGARLGVDYAAVSALGEGLLVSWSYPPAVRRFCGLELYDRQWGFVRQLHPELVHWVRGIDAFGEDVVYCSASFGVREFWERRGVKPGDYVSIRLRDGFVRRLIDMPAWAHHVSSAVSIKTNPNYVYVAYAARSADPSSSWQPYWGEILEVPTDGCGKLRRLVHHRTRELPGRSAKFTQPDFNINHAGTKIIFRSTFANDHADLYMFDLAPRQAVPSRSPERPTRGTAAGKGGPG